MGTVEFEFISPPEAPVFRPSVEEFQDPLTYINKIRPIAEQTGVCKIIPPPEWQPPFAVDVDKLKFTPRIQRLNELEAHTRIKLNFLDQIAKFWELQGSSLKIPIVERKALDLFTLHRLVQQEGGMDEVTRTRKWSSISARMCFPQSKHCLSSTLKSHYERILFPFDVFRSGKGVQDVKLEDDAAIEKVDKDYKPHKIPSRQAVKPPESEKAGRRSKRFGEDFANEFEDEESEEAKNKELKRLQFYGAGPKMPGYQLDQKEQQKNKTRAKKVMYDYDPLAKYVCHVCTRGDSEEFMLLCDGCDDSYHTFCLMPPLPEIPKGDWRCPKCVAEEVSKPIEAFGFEQAQKEYTLQSFGEMADQFKCDYFNMPVHLVPTEMVEKEFWRIVSSIDEDVTVEYGADLHTMDHGSGFPTKNSENLSPFDEEYVNSGWNLNNLPVLEGSVLGHINVDISGMKVPWMYVGMCFSTFCWHNEDHWSYSINYLHWGEPKTWYGVSGLKADAFESAMKSAAPELFKAQPDLLHQLVTIMNPNILMHAGVPIFRTDQQAGEFVITFPRAYHAGFNQGYNFAEAVNFAPPDWLAIGRECVTHYSNLRRFCVFSHDELVCKMASSPDTLTLQVAAATYQDMLKMVDVEKKYRKELLEWGVTSAEREAFELLPDDERQCECCKTTCFLSAITCSCLPNKLVCLRHYDQLCQCPAKAHTLRYRYTLDELPTMLHRLKERAESFDNWVVKVQQGLQATGEDRLELDEVKELLQEAEHKRFPDSELLQAMMEAVQEADKCATVAQHLASKKVRTRTRQSGEAKYHLSVEELQLFCDQIDQLTCKIREADAVKELVDQVKEFQAEATQLIQTDIPASKNVQQCLEKGVALDIELPELQLLKHKVVQVAWLEEMKEMLEDGKDVELEDLRKLLEGGVNLPPHPTVERAMAELQELLTKGEACEEQAKMALDTRPRTTVESAEEMIRDTDTMFLHLPNIESLQELLKKAKEWISKVENVQNGTHYPYLEVLENLVSRGLPISLHLDKLPQLQSQMTAAKTWKDRTARTFLKKNSYYTLVEVLSPRNDIGEVSARARRRKGRDDMTSHQHQAAILEIEIDDQTHPATIVEAYKMAETREINAMRQLRERNIEKRASDGGEGKYCVCRRSLSGHMLQCELCKDWFHASCVPQPKPSGGKGRSQSGANSAQQASRDAKLLCPQCLRSRRPRLETILSLLVSLQKLPVRLPEGEALQCLTERAMNWQDRARQALATEELSSALAKLSVMSQRMSEAAAREKTEKIISKELMRAAFNPELQRYIRELTPVRNSPADDTGGDSVPSPMDSENSDSIPLAEFAREKIVRQHMQEDTATGSFSSSEHAYSTASRPQTGPQAGRKHPRKSPLAPRAMLSEDSPGNMGAAVGGSNGGNRMMGGGGSAGQPLSLSEVTICQLEELMMEGDLLEVSLDETQHIWKILQSTKPDTADHEELFPDIDIIKETEDSDATKQKGKEENKLTKKKRKTVEDVSSGPAATKKLKVRTPKKEEKKTTTKVAEKKRAAREPKAAAARNANDVSMELPKDVSSDDDEDCSASPCLKPTGTEVDWVQCDGGCDLWFHYVCVGLNKDDVKEDEDYVCNVCEARRTEEQVKQEVMEEESVDALLSLANSLPPCLLSATSYSPLNQTVEKKEPIEPLPKEEDALIREANELISETDEILKEPHPPITNGFSARNSMNRQ